jgi:hypothetical protein
LTIDSTIDPLATNVSMSDLTIGLTIDHPAMIVLTTHSMIDLLATIDLKIDPLGKIDLSCRRCGCCGCFRAV